MAKTRNLQVVISGDASSLNRSFNKASVGASQFGRQTQSTGAQVEKSFGSMTKSAAKFAASSVGIASVGIALQKAAQTTVDFDRSMRNVNSIAQLSEKRFGSLEKQVLKLAGPTAQAPKTLADGLYQLVSSGFDANESMTILASSARAATAGLTTTETATTAVAAVLNAYHKPAKDAAAVSDTLFQTVNLGVLSFEQLAENIGDALPFAASLGVSLGEVGAATATMTKQGLSAAETMTRIKNIFVSLLKPNKDLSAAIHETGFASGEALIHAKGFQGALEAIIGTTDGSKREVAALFPNIRSLGGALSLTGKNAKSAEKDLRGFKDTSGATSNALSQQSKSISFQWNRIKATVSAASITASFSLLQAARSVRSFIETNRTVVPVVRAVGAAVAAHIGGMAKVVGSTVQTVGYLLTGQWRKAWNSAKQTVVNFASGMTAAGRSIGHALVAGVLSGLGGLGHAILGKLKSVGGFVGGLFRASGGTVPGPRGAGDIIPAMLSPGEVVLNEKQQQMIGKNSIFSALRATGAPVGMATGGQVAAAARAAGFKGQSLITAIAVADAESGFNEKAKNLKYPDHSIGLWQINQLAHKGKYGSDAALMDPIANARAAFRISGGGKNWGPWSTFTNRAYERYLGVARTLASSAGSSTKTNTKSASSADRVSKYDLVAAQAELGVAQNPGSSSALSTQRGVLQGRINQINRALSQKGHSRAYRLRLTQEKTDLLGQISGINSSIADLSPTSAEAADGSEVDSGAQALADQLEIANQLAQDRATLDKQILESQQKFTQLAEQQGPQLIAQVMAMFSGGIGGKIGLGLQSAGVPGSVANY